MARSRRLARRDPWRTFEGALSLVDELDFLDRRGSDPVRAYARPEPGHFEAPKPKPPMPIPGRKVASKPKMSRRVHEPDPDYGRLRDGAVRLQVWLPAEVVDEFRQACREENRPVGGQVRQLIRRYLARREAGEAPGAQEIAS